MCLLHKSKNTFLFTSRMISMNFPGQNNNAPSILSSIFRLPGWNCASLGGITHHPSGWNCCSSRRSYSLTYIDIQISSCEISNITLTLVYWFLHLLLLLKEEWGVRPEPHISQMQSGEVAVTQQASQLTTKLVMGDMSGLWPLQDAVHIHCILQQDWRKAWRMLVMWPSRRAAKDSASRLHRSYFWICYVHLCIYLYIFFFFFAEHS